MPAYVVVQVRVTDPKTYEEYKQQVSPTIAAYGGRYLVRGGATETLEGDWDPGRFVILEFPDVDQARAWWSSEEYRGPKSLRHAAAESNLLIAEGL
jgi:uncharacterized protein (DUF1330 family)